MPGAHKIGQPFPTLESLAEKLLNNAHTRRIVKTSGFTRDVLKSGILLI